MAVRFKSLKEFGRRSPRIVGAAVGDVGVEFHRRLAGAALRILRSETPRGSGKPPHIAAKSSPAVRQHMRDRWHHAIGRAGVGVLVRDPSSLARQITKPSLSRIGNDSAAIKIINKGISRTRPHKRLGKTIPGGRRIGSSQASRGIIRPARQRITALANRMGREAVRRAEGRVRK